MTIWPRWRLRTLSPILGAVPESIRTAVQNNAGGHANHSLFWTVMGGAGHDHPHGALADAIGSAFGSLDAFKDEFAQAATTRFGSGMGVAGENQQR